MRVVGIVGLVFLVFAAPTFAASVEVTYSFGKIELLRQGHQEWEFLKKGTRLQPEDRLRMPPVSILRLKTSEGTMLPALTGVREARVAQVVRESYAKMERLRRYRKNPLLQEEVAIDVIPAGAPLRSRDTAKESLSRLVVDPQGFAQLQDRLKAIPGPIRQQAQRWNRGLSRPEYGSLPMYRAVALFQHWMEERGEAPLSIESLLHYAWLLRASDVEVHFVQTRWGEPILLINTELLPAQTRMVTVNQDLIRIERNTLWIPLRLEDDGTRSFVGAWYQGARAIQAAYEESERP